ncbi:hypothetical protein ACQCP0_23670 [Ralstonia pseudosolanacearum]|uniref:hypothetical protein n=1 Tax=Ralstonia pseudosolanacearum TaxID=1310165 RepID=UPI000B210F9B|nr:hypothetical protein [Ralstonia pseudosolanacearum]QKL57633.1 hypothetical protein HI814_13675 [Ralstonia solanacearum]QKL72361.1 hypothetical protein HI806_14415 [Ralstonia solanacearum]QKL77566.1 hypothetical protein HI805_14425 [Ralstonia solanacearum]QKL82772.1 hypothetical protein HI804_14425 [Ralstonia solanacearum]QKL87982.1 hypothetical protein HI803_14430 [Ralstonia solanacearum]
MPATTDTQLTEIFGRNRLINDLLRSGIEVATPVRDRGVDLIAYVDIDEQIGKFAAVPIQIKAATQRSFSIDRKYAKFPDLLLAFVWGVQKPEAATIYALTYLESLDVGESMGWLQTESWREGGRYTTTAPSERLLGLLSRYEVQPGTWKARITSVLRSA